MPAVQISRIMKGVSAIPPMPESIMHLMEISNSNRYFTREFAAIIETDPSLTAGILKVANSAYASQSRQISSVSEAVTILGKNMVVSTAIRSFTGDFFDRKLAGYGNGEHSLWKHSFATAIAAREIAFRGNGSINPETSFTAGILHDVGKVLISEYMSGGTEIIVNKSEKEEDLCCIELEREVLGTDHCEIGGLLAEKWKLPDMLAESIRCHHAPSLAGSSHMGMVSAVHAGNVLAMMMGVLTCSGCSDYRLDRSAEENLGISESTLAGMKPEVEKKYANQLAMYSWQ